MSEGTAILNFLASFTDHVSFTNVFLETSFLTISFNHTIAVVAHISKQLFVTMGEKQISNTVTVK